jgi:hypothetical protein
MEGTKQVNLKAREGHFGRTPTLNQASRLSQITGVRFYLRETTAMPGLGHT